jgi:ribosome-binding protein aMBF1 (putative translation factor)
MSLAASKKQTFEELTVGHTFTYGKKEDKLPVGSFFWCALCGGRGRQAHTVIRDDGVELKVGTTCLDRIGLSAPEEPKKAKPAVVEEIPEVVKEILESPVEVEPVDPKPVDPEDLDDIFNDLEGKK